MKKIQPRTRENNGQDSVSTSCHQKPDEHKKDVFKQNQSATNNILKEHVWKTRGYEAGHAYLVVPRQ